MSNSDADPLGERSGATKDVVASDDVTRWFADNFDKLEFLIESSGRSSELDEQLKAYVGDLREEHRTYGLIRGLTLIGALIYIIFMNSLLVCIIFWHKSYFLFMGNYTKTALILAIITSSVVIVLKVIQGTFRMRAERNVDGMLPAQIRELVEAYNAARGM